MKVHRLLALAAAVMLVSSCAQAVPGTPASTPEPSPQAGAFELAGTQWQLSELGAKPPVEGTTITAQFSSDGVVAGSGGCNRYRAAFTTSGDTIKIDEAIASTMMACEPEVMEQETAFFAALGAAKGFTATPEKLALTGEDGTELATFAVQSQGLADTKWKVTGYNNGKEAVVSPLPEVEATLEFGADGTVSGTGGCNRITGGFTAEDGKVKMGPLVMTSMACPEPEGVMEQEAAFVKALESAATYTVEGNLLEMRTADDAIAVHLVRA